MKSAAGLLPSLQPPTPSHPLASNSMAVVYVCEADLTHKTCIKIRKKGLLLLVATLIHALRIAGILTPLTPGALTSVLGCQHCRLLERLVGQGTVSLGPQGMTQPVPQLRHGGGQQSVGGMQRAGAEHCQAPLPSKIRTCAICPISSKSTAGAEAEARRCHIDECKSTCRCRHGACLVTS